MTCVDMPTPLIAAFILSATCRSTWLSTDGGMVHTHQSALSCFTAPVLLSCQVTVTPCSFCATLLTLAL